MDEIVDRLAAVTDPLGQQAYDAIEAGVATAAKDVREKEITIGFVLGELVRLHAKRYPLSAGPLAVMLMGDIEKGITDGLR